MSRVLRSVTALAVTLFLAVPASARAAVADPAAGRHPRSRRSSALPRL